HRDTGARPGWQIDIHAGAETDEAEALSHRNLTRRLGPAKDAPGHETGNLHHGDWTVRTFDNQTVALVLGACLVEIRVQEPPGPIFYQRDASPDRRAVYVAGKDIHEDGDPHPVRTVESEFRRRGCGPYGRNHPVCRGNDEPVVHRRHPGRIAEEVGAPSRQQKADPEKRRPKDTKEDRTDNETGDEAVALPVDGHERFSDRVCETHLFCTP